MARLATNCLLVKELVTGKGYLCTLSGNRRVQYIGKGTIKWYNSDLDEYRTHQVTDYQLKPMEDAPGQV